MNIEAKNRVNMEDRLRASQPSGFVLMESSLLSYPSCAENILILIHESFRPHTQI